MLNLRSFQVIRFIERCLHGRQDDSSTYTITSHWGMPSRKNRQFAPEDRKFPPIGCLSSNHWFSREVCYFQGEKNKGVTSTHWSLIPYLKNPGQRWIIEKHPNGWHSMFRAAGSLRCSRHSLSKYPSISTTKNPSKTPRWNIYRSLHRQRPDFLNRWARSTLQRWKMVNGFLLGYTLEN